MRLAGPHTSVLRLRILRVAPGKLEPVEAADVVVRVGHCGIIYLGGLPWSFFEPGNPPCILLHSPAGRPHAVVPRRPIRSPQLMHEVIVRGPGSSRLTSFAFFHVSAHHVLFAWAQRVPPLSKLPVISVCRIVPGSRDLLLFSFSLLQGQSGHDESRGYLL